MSIYNEIKRALSTTVDVIVDKTTTQAQKSRLVTVMKNEEKIANQAYIELGKYLYNNLRNDVPEDIAELCVAVDQSKERMSRAQEIYREVIQQELVNREINKTETIENLKNIKDPIVSKAKDTAAKVKGTAKDTAVKVKGTAKDTAVKVGELKDSAAVKATDIKNRVQKTVEHEKEEIAEKAEKVIEKIEVIQHVAPEGDPASSEEVLTVGQGLSENVDVIENAIFSDSSLGEDTVEPVEEPREIFSSTLEKEPEKEEEKSEPVEGAVSEAADVEDTFVPETEPVDQEFQRTVPVDIITENDFEEDEPEVKPIEKNTPFTKAMKLRQIITKKNPEE